MQATRTSKGQYKAVFCINMSTQITICKQIAAQINILE